MVSAGDTGLPHRATAGVAATNIEAFAEGLAADRADVLLFLAIREAARQRLFGAVGWLGPQLLAYVEHYAREITIDPHALEQAIESQLNSAMTAGELEDAGTALAGSLFAPQVTDEQREVLERLETLLALVEGWVDEVVARVAGPRMPVADALTETLRRRRATGGPAESALKSLVGLELRPRRTRDAANLWAATRAARGAEARDAAWDHPDLLPTASDLADPLGFAAEAHPPLPRTTSTPNWPGCWTRKAEAVPESAAARSASGAAIGDVPVRRRGWSLRVGGAANSVVPQGRLATLRTRAQRVLVSLQERFGALTVGVAGHECVEPWGVVRFEQVRQFVHQHVIADPGRHGP